MLRKPTVLLVSAGIVLAIAGARGGSTVLGWTAVGLFGTAAYLWGTWLGIRLATDLGSAFPAGTSATRRRATILILLFLLKALPMFLLALAAREARPEVRTGLLTGAAVVYCWLVAWGFTPDPPRARPDP